MQNGYFPAIKKVSKIETMQMLKEFIQIFGSDGIFCKVLGKFHQIRTEIYLNKKNIILLRWSHEPEL